MPSLELNVSFLPPGWVIGLIAVALTVHVVWTGNVREDVLRLFRGVGRLLRLGVLVPGEPAPDDVAPGWADERAFEHVHWDSQSDVSEESALRPNGF
ncbi:hypothetical protein SPBR_05431 [Sporothrix brasiliensis 5110]|uniref:Uncharacterized protein n=1 Tax=Sporothrix brasiliensis 5110 TaxID=1398154 RepID=A0A0C2IPT2_9PEZI|nr:uncharacterized protein SPBR_05431 [Sporothrix brasiliensis 5110]KIH87077.1 hypothetical protein SPBR_05431 [Sporothrix brasiliensis 5110]